MGTTNYKEILNQAKSQNADNPTSIQAEQTVNLCVRVPKSWRTKVKASAITHDLTLEELVKEAVDRFMEQEGWDDLKKYPY